MGIRKVQDVNVALFAKLGWKVSTNPNNLLVKVVPAKYLTGDDFLEAKELANFSPLWKYILDRRYFIKKDFLGFLEAVRIVLA